MNSRFLLLNFDIYTMIYIKHLLSQYFILHQSSRLYYWQNKMCTIVTPKQNEEHGNDQDL
jgi:hypothetical protein